MWDKVKRLGRNQRTILKVLAPCGGLPQPVESVRWLAALERGAVHVVPPEEAGQGEEPGPAIDASFRGSFEGSLDRLEERGLVERWSVDASPGVVHVAPTPDGWAAIETLGLTPG